MFCSYIISIKRNRWLLATLRSYRLGVGGVLSSPSLPQSPLSQQRHSELKICMKTLCVRRTSETYSPAASREIREARLQVTATTLRSEVFTSGYTSGSAGELFNPGAAPGPADGRGGFGAPQVMEVSARGAGGDDFDTFYDPVLSPQRPLCLHSKCLSGSWITHSLQIPHALGDSRSDYPFPQCSLPLSLQTALDRVVCH